METRLTPSLEPRPVDFPDADELAMLRAWYAGMSVRKAVERYLAERVGAGQSARGVIGDVRRRLRGRPCSCSSTRRLIFLAKNAQDGPRFAARWTATNLK